MKKYLVLICLIFLCGCDSEYEHKRSDAELGVYRSVYNLGYKCGERNLDKYEYWIKIEDTLMDRNK